MDKVTGFEIPAGRTERAGKFYRNVFGWKIEGKDEEYAHIKTVEMDRNWVPKEKGAVNGGLVKKEGKSDSPLLVITVDSIEKTLDKVRKAKGKVITGKQEAGEWGWWALIKDTEGNTFELWEDME